MEEAVGQGGLAGLVNNAGTAVAGPLALQPLDDVRAQFEANVVALISVTQAFLPLLGMHKSRVGGYASGPGRIVNMSSVGGKVASPFLGAYAGTKHAVEGLSDSLRRELLPYGIDVIVVRPGAVKTEIWAKGARSKALYADSDYREPLEKFEAYAGKLAEGGYSPETSAGSSCGPLRRRGRGPGTPSCAAGSPTGSSPRPCRTACWTASSEGLWA